MSYRPPRRPSDLRLVLRIGARRSQAQLLDLSDTGVKLCVADPPAPGAKVTLQTPRWQGEATVMWVRGDRAGLALTRPLSPAERAELSTRGWAG